MTAHTYSTVNAKRVTHLHRNTPRLASTWGSIFAFGWGSAAFAWFVDTLDRWPDVSRYSPMYFYTVGPLIGLMGLLQLLVLLRRFRLTVGDCGLVVRKGRRTHRLTWAEVHLVEVAPSNAFEGNARWEQASLVVWPVGQRRLAGLTPYRPDGRTGFALLPLDDFKESPGRVIEALQRHGGEKVDAGGYLNYVETRSRIAEFLRDIEAETEAQNTR